MKFLVLCVDSTVREFRASKVFAYYFTGALEKVCSTNVKKDSYIKVSLSAAHLARGNARTDYCVDVDVNVGGAVVITSAIVAVALTSGAN